MKRLLSLLALMLLSAPLFGQNWVKYNSATTIDLPPFQDSTGALTAPTVTGVTITVIKQSDTGSTTTTTWTCAAWGTGSHDCQYHTGGAGTSILQVEVT